MSDYFDAFSLDLLNYLPARVAERDDVYRVAPRAEADVIAHYTRATRDTRFTVEHTRTLDQETGKENLSPTTGNRTVYLRHYKADADDVDTSDTDKAAFVEAMRREIADVIVWRMAQEDAHPFATSEKHGRRSFSYGDHSRRHRRFPPGFGQHLKPFDLRPQPFIA